MWTAQATSMKQICDVLNDEGCLQDVLVGEPLVPLPVVPPPAPPAPTHHCFPPFFFLPSSRPPAAGARRCAGSPFFAPLSARRPCFPPGDGCFSAFFFFPPPPPPPLSHPPTAPTSGAAS